MADDFISHLTYYGMEPQHDDGDEPFSGVFEYLGRGRTTHEIKESLKSLQNSYPGYQRIEDVWHLGLTTGMANGLGCTAVYVLLDHIAGLVSGLQTSEVYLNGVPKLAILSVTASLPDDGFSMESSSSFAQTSSSASVAIPSAKRRKVATPAMAGSSVQTESAANSEKDGAPKAITFQSHSQPYVDMIVACMDCASGVAKYVLLVEIHSGGKSVSAVMRKLTTEIVHALQSQNLVFGLFFGKIDVVLISGIKQASGQIYVSEHNYSLVEGHFGDIFSVKNFQLLIMDIFCCMIYGMESIDA